MSHNKEFILKFAHDNNVKFIRLWFTDVLGFLKSFAITIDELEDAITEGIRFDGATLQGKIRSGEQEMMACPDLTTFKILPWRPQEDAVARMFCDIRQIDMSPFPGDSRYILKNNLQKIALQGLVYYTGPEIEFFFFKDSNKPTIIDNGGYFDLTPLDVAADYRRQVVLTLEDMEIDAISSHHEVAPSQHEIDLRHEDALTTADNIMTFKLITKEIGQLNDIYASFMPKPLANQNGSGLHLHQSLFKNDKNIFHDKNKKNSFSKKGEQFIAGILEHSHEFMAITNQWINSYKRLFDGFEAPIWAGWSFTDPRSLVRIPQSKKNKPNSTRIELRNPDPSCNPYLTFSAVLAAGMKGIEGKYKLGDPLDSSSKKIKPLPATLDEALLYFEKSSLMKETLGDFIHSVFLENKKIELDNFKKHISDYELDNYLPVL
jgi:glutamine synthetase